MSSSSSPPPPSTPHVGAVTSSHSEITISAEERARRELEDSMRSSPIPEADDEDTFSANNSPTNEDESVFNPANFGNVQVSQTPGSHVTSPWSTSSLRIEMESARRLAVSKKLHPYQRDTVDTFLKSSSIAREAQLFIALCELGNKFDSIASAAPSFTVGPALLENIKTYTMAVLLSSKLEVYKGVVPRDHVLAIIRKEGLNIPPNFDRDPHVLKVVGMAIADELTQVRSRIKKAVGASIKDHTTIYDLAESLTDGTKCIVSVPLCARLTLLRKVYLENNTKNFWDAVDSRLKLIQSTASGDARKVTRAFKKILDEDRQTYGDVPSTIAVQDEADAWQDSVDQVISA